MRQIITILVFGIFTFNGKTQSFLTPADSLNTKRAIGVTSVLGTGWAGSILALQYVWYADFDKSPFHFFDDSHEWNQMDKMGHMYTSWQMSRAVNDSYKWAGLSHQHAALIGLGVSMGYLATFEILDGFNSKWGFSWADIGFNSIGAITYASQAYLWNEQYALFKFSYQPSGLAEYRPTVLGNDFTSRLLKDYNGQTYWMSFNPFSWAKGDSKVPKWLCLSLGYGIHDQLIGDGGTYIYTTSNQQETFTPYRQYYLSIDIDFESIPTNSNLLKLLFKGLNCVKLPFPALEFSQGTIKGRAFHF